MTKPKEKPKQVWLVFTAGQFPSGLGDVRASSEPEAIRLGRLKFKQRVSVLHADA